MRKLLSAVLLFALMGAAFASPRVDTSDVPQFKTEQDAQHHCPGDTVVWLNTRSGIWHY